MGEEGTNYRKVYKSDHLGVIDLEELIETKKSLIFTVKEVKQEIKTRVAGSVIDANIAYFVEDAKPLVLNATNAAVLRKLSGGSMYVENWTNVRIEMYIDANVKMKGAVVGGVRIRPVAPPLPVLDEKHKSYQAIKDALKAKTYTIAQIKTKYRISADVEKLILK